jgi:hypothetical protein
LTRRRRPAARRQEGKPLSQVACLIVASKTDRPTLPVVADWLEEKLGLTATAFLLRQPGLPEVPEEWDVLPSGLDWAPLAPDAFAWLVGLQFALAPTQFDRTPGVVVGLYAHPHDRPDVWAKVAQVLVLGPGMDARAEEAGKELPAFAQQQRSLP